MSTQFIIYCLLLFLASAATFPLARRDGSLWFLFAVLASSLIEELVFEWIDIATHRTNSPYYIYYLYGPIYYALFAGYFMKNIPDRRITNLIPYSIGFYTGGIIVSYFANNSVWLEINVAGMLLIPLCLISLYSMNIKDLTPIYRRPLFWVSVATFVFYTSEFVVLGLKSYLSIYSDDKANSLAYVLNYVINYLYYSLIITGMLLCLPSARRLSRP